MTLKLGQVHVGKVDGKHEYLTPTDERERLLFDAFLLPDSVEPDRLNNSDIFFVSGFRGTGKTSLLRWHAEQRRIQNAVTEFVLFKTDLTEVQRLSISKEVGITWLDVDAKSMEVSQDFKDAWTWFLLHKVGEKLRDNVGAFEDYDGSVEKAFRLLGLRDDTVYKKLFGYLPKLDGAHVKVRSDLKFFEAELGGDFLPNGATGSTTLSALSSRIAKKLNSATMLRPLFIYLDELEVFHHTPEQHRRDQCMVRDLLFAVSSVNELFRAGHTPIHIVAAVRSEVVGSMGSLGQEVDRLVHDKGFLISWHHAKRSMSHPLIQIVRQKLIASEIRSGMAPSENPMHVYFPEHVNGEPIDTFMLDRSFYKPRDIVWRLSIAQKLFPQESCFSENVLHETEIDYSTKLWDEVRYELSAIYSDAEVDAIEAAIAGGSASFDLQQMSGRFVNASSSSQVMTALLARRSVREILVDLYRLGAIGNSFRVGTTGNQFKNRWSFRAEPTLLAEKRMVIHPALLKRLSVVGSRRRGTRGGSREGGRR